MNELITTNFVNVEIIDAKVDAYVERFKMSMKQTAKSIIDMGNTIYEACRYLGEVPLGQFCDQIEMKSTDPMFKKLKKIGEMHARLEANVEKLPNAWTTIYKLAQMTEDEFVKIVDANILSPDVTAKEINNCLGKTKTRNEIANATSNSITISFAQVNVANAALLVAKIEQLEKEFNFELQVPDELKIQISSYKQGEEA
jgi:hypothetical protein